MYNKKGFSLLSFLLYLVLFSMITFFSCHIIISFIIPSFSAMHKCQSLIALHIASDLFVRDIRMVKGNECEWKLISPHELVWQTKDGDLGWCFADNRLERKEGTYNQGWKSKKTSVVAANIAQAAFVVEKARDKIIGIELTIKPILAVKEPIVCYVAVRKGEVL